MWHLTALIVIFQRRLYEAQAINNYFPRAEEGLPSLESLIQLKESNQVNLSAFCRKAISEKIKREMPR